MFYPGLLALRGTGDGERTVSEVLQCPLCERKLSIKSDHAGKRLRCPHCKEIFTAPAPEPELAAETVEQAPAEAAMGGGFFEQLHAPDPPGQQQETSGPVGGSGGGFFDDLQTTAAAAPTASAAAAAPASESAASNGSLLDELDAPDPMGLPMAPAARPQIARPTTRSKSSGKSGQIPKEWIIGGAIGGGLLLFLLVLVVILTSGPSRKGGGKSQGTVKWGVGEGQRKEIFMDLVSAIDLNGYDSPARTTAWQATCREHKITMDIAGKIEDEGFAQGWDLPVPKVNQSTGRSHRMDYIKMRTQAGK